MVPASFLESYMSVDATELYADMYAAIRDNNFVREATDASSPAKTRMHEAPIGQVFRLYNPQFNAVACRPVTDWAKACVLHFFAATDDGSMLERWNKLAPRFLVNGKWFRSYGTAFMPQIRCCIELLKKYPNTRRAIDVSDSPFHQDINCPQCMTSMQFITNKYGQLDLAVHQRSLNLSGVMPYDVVLLTNILIFVAKAVGKSHGTLHWFIGSLHMPEVTLPPFNGERKTGIVLDFDLLNDPSACLDALTR